MSDLVSIIMPVYNTEKYVSDSIDSVLTQTYKNLELVIINDGSTDDSGELISEYQDSRIKYIKKENGGVSSARNVGLNLVKGNYLCFLDSDDVLPKNSIESRMNVFKKNPDVSFVDGKVSIKSDNLSKELGQWHPAFEGDPTEELVKLTGACFFGITWMIRTEDTQGIKFDTQLTHAEDLWYYIQISHRSKIYSFTEDCTYVRRLSSDSAMSNLDGLSKGYRELNIRLLNTGLPSEWIKTNENKARSILFKSYLAKGNFVRAIPFLFRL